MSNEIRMRVSAGTKMPYEAREIVIIVDSYQNIHNYGEEAIAMSEKLFQNALGVVGKWTPYSCEEMDADWHVEYQIVVHSDSAGPSVEFLTVDCNLAVCGTKNIETMIKLATRNAIHHFVQRMPRKPMTDCDSGETLERATQADLDKDMEDTIETV